MKPDYWNLYPFGAVGAFWRIRDGNHKQTKFKSQCLFGIVLGRNKYTNGMIFYNPILDSFSVSAVLLIDKNRQIGEVFDNI